MTWNPNATVTIGGVDFSGDVLAGMSINYGRTSIWDQARASYAQISILNANLVDNGFEINDSVVVTIEDSDGDDITVFTGKITDLTNEVAASGSSATVAIQTITAVGPFAQMSRTIVGTTNYPKEYDDDRIDRILTEAGVTIDVVDTPGVYELVERPANPQDAYSLATYYAGMCFGYLYETTNGEVGYANESRRTIDVTANGYLDIDEGYINWRGIQSQRSIKDIVNKVILFYKNSDQVSAEDLSSVSQYGLIEARIDTELHNADEAINIAERYVSLRSTPETNFSSFNINLDNPNLLTADLDDLIAIQMGTAIQIDNLPNPISPLAYTGFVEGWTLTINQFQALLTITSSDSSYSIVPIRWQDVDPLTQWDDIDPTATRSTKTNLLRNPSFEPIDYGQIGYVDLPGATGYMLTAPDESALDITGDIDLRAKIAMDDWTPSAQTNILYKHSTSNASYGLTIETNGRISLYWSILGSTYTSATSSVATGVTDGNVKWIRATLDVNNGASGRDIKFFLSDDGTAWTQLGTTVTQAGTTSIFSGSGTLQLGGFALTTPGMAGKFYAASIRNGIDGTEVFACDIAGNWKPTNIDSFTATTGQTVSLSNLMKFYNYFTLTGAVSRVTNEKYSGLCSLKFEATTTAVTSTVLLATTITKFQKRIPCASGDTFYLQARIKQGSGSRTGRIRILTYSTETTTTITEQFLSSTTTLDSTWKLIQVTGTLTNANSLFLTPYFEMANTGLIGDFIYVDSLILEKNSGGYAAYYFDGSYSEIPDIREPVLTWSGSANNSTSTANTYWATLPATTWANVDQQGLP